MKLQTMTDFVLEFVPESETDDTKLLDQVLNYATFLKKPLTLGMFVPCDENGNVLTEPIYDPSNEQYWAGEHYQFTNAKERVLFKDVVVRIDKDTKSIYINGYPTVISDLNIFSIEDIIHQGFELSDSAIKQLGL